MASCPMPDQCHTESYDSASDQCVSTNKPDGTPCDDGDKCTTHDLCNGKGACVGTRTACPSGPCATAACDGNTGQCTSTKKFDGTPCGGGGTCRNGACSLGR